MKLDIEALVDDVWRSKDRTHRAIELEETLSPEVRRALQEVLTNLQTRADARSTLRGKAISKQDTVTNQLTGNANAALLVLLCLAIYNSDELIYLPYELRKSRIEDWSKQTGFPLQLVHEAIDLGPAGIRPLLAALNDGH